MNTINCKVNLELFIAKENWPPQTKMKLTTTEYLSGNNMLVYQEIGHETQALANNILSFDFNRKINLSNAYFFYKKTYSTKPRMISKDAFLERLGGFKRTETSVSQEILLEYKYHDKNGRQKNVDIVVNRYEDREPTAQIHFSDGNEYEELILPDWLIPID